MLGKNSLLFVILLCLALGTSLANNNRKPHQSQHEDGDENENSKAFHALFEESDDGDEDDHDGYVHFPPNIHVEDWPRMTWHIRAHIAVAIFETIPNIPVELINLIVYKDLEFLEFIVKKHDNIEGLVRHMDPSTVQHFCEHVPSFGIRVGRLDAEVLETLTAIHPTLVTCIVRPVTTEGPATTF